MLTDWGPTNTGWFRSGQEHKHACLTSLAADFPGIRWVLVGDDGQHDPEIYAAFARAHPDRVRAIALRELTATQQVLSHGIPTEKTPAISTHVPAERPGGPRRRTATRWPARSLRTCRPT